MKVYKTENKISQKSSKASEHKVEIVHEIGKESKKDEKALSAKHDKAFQVKAIPPSQANLEDLVN